MTREFETVEEYGKELFLAYVTAFKDVAKVALKIERAGADAPEGFSEFAKLLGDGVKITDETPAQHYDNIFRIRKLSHFYYELKRGLEFVYDYHLWT
jgi:hypothetical protein